ncbi:uncharacterized protein LOC118751858 [Rhagoletis pomonella]|uniref:uncharacterized protein LOC118751858 n=1 Tax=Rhagoletis pomonella TaxID=28610 RepID=UPI00177F470F|nr:uncharacterized protein LOC118751858 [Rhagoletis pomonella]
MEDYSDTDGWNEDTLKSPQRIKRNVCSKAASNGVDHDFNDMLTYAQSHHYNNHNPILSLLSLYHHHRATNISNRRYHHRTSNQYYKYAFLKQIQSPEEVEEVDIGSLLKNISESLIQIQQNQNVIIRALAKQSAFKDIIINRINDIENLFNNNKNSTVDTVEDNTSASSAGLLDAPISNQDEIDELEDKLNDSKKMEDLVCVNVLRTYYIVYLKLFYLQAAKMKSICGEKGTADATDCCYRLVDHFFTREFLLNVSWSGGSRTENKKVALKNYSNILSVGASCSQGVFRNSP